VVPVLLAGGSGTRLWPASRARFPKQFAPLLGRESLFQAAARRFAAPGFAPPLIVTTAEFRFIVAEQLEEGGLPHGPLLLEPAARNTAGAAIVAALACAREAPESLILITPSDHLIADPGAFRAAVARGIPAARAGQIVTFGIRPDRAETGYGWLATGAATHPGVERLDRFIEKPDAARAERLLATPGHLWNAGLFLAEARVLVAAARAHAPDVLTAAEAALAAARPDLGFLRLDAAAWAGMPSISLDHAIMEKAGNLSVVRFDGAWSDLGAWSAVWAEADRDATGTALQGRATAIDCADTLLRSEPGGPELVGIGLRGLAAVATRDAVLVADLGASQSVRLAVAALAERGAPEATAFPRERRPWGWYEVIAAGDRFQVKRIQVHPGAALSLQSHRHRSEHWVVVQGTARVTLGDDVRLLSANQSIYVPQGAVHRLENPGEAPVTLIEVQTGDYLGEDDITRYEDRYARD
jgi:mannose-1-phosphate guanylyltransferase/mannose-1-phosphate guanylyltransferase/mannose-6-phosphate isomerase